MNFPSADEALRQTGYDGTKSAPVSFGNNPVTIPAAVSVVLGSARASRAVFGALAEHIRKLTIGRRTILTCGPRGKTLLRRVARVRTTQHAKARALPRNGQPGSLLSASPNRFERSVLRGTVSNKRGEFHFTGN